MWFLRHKKYYEVILFNILWTPEELIKNDKFFLRSSVKFHNFHNENYENILIEYKIKLLLEQPMSYFNTFLF